MRGATEQQQAEFRKNYDARAPQQDDLFWERIAEHVPDEAKRDALQEHAA